MNLLKEIWNNEGLEGLFKGIKPRIMKVTVHGGLVYTIYEYMKEYLTGRKEFH